MVMAFTVLLMVLVVTVVIGVVGYLIDRSAAPHHDGAEGGRS